MNLGIVLLYYGSNLAFPLVYFLIMNRLWINQVYVILKLKNKCIVAEYSTDQAFLLASLIEKSRSVEKNTFLLQKKRFFFCCKNNFFLWQKKVFLRQKKNNFSAQMKYFFSSYPERKWHIPSLQSWKRCHFSLKVWGKIVFLTRAVNDDFVVVSRHSLWKILSLTCA